ncbi:hypothetical protein NP233_g6477 [Leucocoprinus birnbaumii]|uniref:Pheromone receptor n=1 Tax=Leucocoprinus birnbaumii TaxID=56174 RepID=A0AAD5VTS4_9AGAR|nr:hypothetical protein NP233_g6477 [Leucocoprinus birnbaumii]
MEGGSFLIRHIRDTPFGTEQSQPQMRTSSLAFTRRILREQGNSSNSVRSREIGAFALKAVARVNIKSLPPPVDLPLRTRKSPVARRIRSGSLSPPLRRYKTAIDAISSALWGLPTVGLYPLLGHWLPWNTGTCLYMAWSGLACLGLCINSIVWHGNAINWAPVWCDIFTHFMVGVNVAIPACSLCINRRLYHIASVRKVTISKAEKRRQIAVDLAIALGIPMIAMVLQYITQGHRFDIYEDFGCLTATYATWVALVFVNIPPLLLGLCSGTYAILSIRAFNKSRAQSKEMLSSYSNLSSSRYIRLMALAATDVIGTVPLAIFVIVENMKGPRAHWISWQDTHANFSRVVQLPALIWRQSQHLEIALEVNRWAPVACAIVFFAFFGFADEARKHYRSAASSAARLVGVSTGSFGNSSGLFSSSGGGVGSHPGSIPGFGTEKVARKDSFDGSFSDASSNLKEGGILSAPASPIIDEKKNSSFTNVFSLKKKPLNQEVFNPNFHYNDLVLPDIGGALEHEGKDDDVLTIPSTPSSSASSISIPEPVVIRPHTADVPVSVDPRRNSHDMV